MMGAAFGQGVTGLAGMRGDSGRMAHPSGAAIEASFGVGTGEVHSLEAVCPPGDRQIGTKRAGLSLGLSEFAYPFLFFFLSHLPIPFSVFKP